MHIVEITIVGGIHRDDRFEMRRLKFSNLNGREAAPRNAPHAHITVAPYLPCQPFDHVIAILCLFGHVFAISNAVAAACAAYVESAKSKAALRPILTMTVIGVITMIVLAIRNHFENGRE